MMKTSLKNFNKGAAAPKALVLNFEFWSFEFVSNFGFRASDLKTLKFFLKNEAY